jgi:hypothetical protein
VFGKVVVFDVTKLERDVIGMGIRMGWALHIFHCNMMGVQFPQRQRTVNAYVTIQSLKIKVDLLSMLPGFPLADPTTTWDKQQVEDAWKPALCSLTESNARIAFHRSKSHVVNKHPTVRNLLKIVGLPTKTERGVVRLHKQKVVNNLFACRVFADYQFRKVRHMYTGMEEWSALFDEAESMMAE